jgi:trimeric autotransporter adhesin
MKKITILFFVSLLNITANAQTIVQSEDFTTYAGTAATVPAGWTFTYNGNYTSTASSGTSGPNSYKFGVNNAKITSPLFVSADSVSFWIKGNSTDTMSTLSVLESADNITWDTIAKIVPIPTTATGQTYKFPVDPTSHYIAFHYFKSVGNVAFDDYRLLLYGPTSINTSDNSAVASLSPNPSNGLFTLNIDKTAKAQVTVYNIVGKKILEKEVVQGKQELDLSAEPNGSYFVKITSDKKVITKKIIINK